MRNRVCYIIGAGDFTARGLSPKPGDMVIAADGGYAALKKLGIRPHAVIGDMDSYQGRVAGVPLIRFPTKKDDTDTSLALRLGLRRSFRHFRLFGASGDRIDHFQANLQLMHSLSRRGCHLRLMAPGFTVYAVSNSGLAIHGVQPGQTVSVLAFGGIAQGVTLRGLLYPLRNATLSHLFPLGVSNRAVRPVIGVRVRRGTLMVFVMEPGG